MRNIIIRLLVILLLTNLQNAFSQPFSYKEQKELSGFEDFVLMAGFSPFRNYFAATIGSNRLLLYNKNWEVIFDQKGNPESKAGLFAFSPDEQLLVYAKYKYMNDIAIIRLSDLKVIQVLTEPKGWVYELKISPDGKWLAACSEDKMVYIWKWEGRQYALKYKLTDHTKEVISIDFNSKSNLIASAGHDNCINIYKLSENECKKVQVITLKEYFRDVIFHPTKDLLFAGTSQRIQIFTKHGNEFVPKDTLEASVNSKMSFSPDGRYLVFGEYNDLDIYAEKGDSYVENDRIFRHSDNVFGGTFSDDGKFLTSTSSDKSAIIWDVKGVQPTNKSQLVEYLGKDITTAQRQILRKDVVDLIIKKIDKNLTLPKDEFETSVEYQLRMEKLSSIVLGGLQKQLEKDYGIKASGQSEVIIPVQKLISYNADLKIYKIQFMETEAGVEIPVEEARALKNNPSKAIIKAKKSPSKDGNSFIYSEFLLVHPNGKAYKLTPIENPFHSKSVYVQGRQYQYKVAAPDEEVNTEKTETPGYLSHALIFASNVYDAFGELINPVFDARTIASELEDNYNTYVDLVENPTLNEAVGRIREYARKKYDDNDYLLIFFAGHGTYDEVFKEGYVVFRDSKTDDVAKSTYMSHSNLRTMINNIPCNHIMLVMDVCFGGTFDPLIASRSRSAEMYADISNEEYLARKAKYVTRYYLTSGGKEYVPDGRPGQHSPFARKFIEALRNYGGSDKILTTNEILQFIEKVDPQPCFGEFGNNEPGSDFILMSK